MTGGGKETLPEMGYFNQVLCLHLPFKRFMMYHCFFSTGDLVNSAFLIPPA